jgi:hypothetical protein
MPVSIHLNDQPSGTTEEVHDVAADDLLPPKLHPEALATDGRPEKHFRVRGMVPHEAGTVLEELTTDGGLGDGHEDLSARSDAALARPLAQVP